MATPLEQALRFIHAGQPARAEPLLRRILQRSPRDAVALRTLASIMQQSGRMDQAIFNYQQAAAAAPNDVSILSDLASTLLDHQQIDEGVTIAQRAVAMAPSDAGAHMLLGKGLELADQFLAARAAYEQAIAMKPTFAMAHCHLADLLIKMGEPELAFERARQTSAHSHNFLHQATTAAFSNYVAGLTPQAVKQEHLETVRRMDLVAKPSLPPLSSLNIDKNPDRPLRIAFLSPDFVQHSVTYYSEPIISNLDRAQFELTAVFPSQISDATTTRLRKLFSRFHVLPEPNEAQVINLLRTDRIDIAIDIGGYTNSSALWTLRQRICPVQVSYIGYPNTTAITNIDYRIVDSTTDPVGQAEALCTERLVRIDPCFLCYGAPADAPPVTPAPCTLIANTPVTFGSFNFVGKMSRDTKDLWARVLLAVPGSTLLLKEGFFTSADVRAHVRAAFASRGVDPERIIMIAKTPSRNEHLALYGRVDIALDPMPYNGTTTTCEALLMGVPVLAVEGPSHVSRVSASLLRAVGAEAASLVARSPDELVNLAVELAADRARLAHLRQTLRPTMLASPLCDAPTHAVKFGHALRTMWQTYCAAS